MYTNALKTLCSRMRVHLMYARDFGIWGKGHAPPLIACGTRCGNVLARQQPNVLLIKH